MALEAGTRLGPYEVASQIGKGGMGEVYQARDTKLDRDVALKILPEDVAADPDRLARFQREAKVLASLNHPNIAAIHGLEDSTDTLALVLELVPGPTLQDRIAQGAIPLDEALPIAKQIAEALEAAHEQGIIHRDLKPANIKVTPDGVMKVLDFGLAKALEPERSDEDIANSPTMSMTAAATKMGMVMGTAAYMSPEQAKGKPVDKRTDIWAYGVVLYEMLTGRQAFAASDISETLAFVLTREIDWSALPGETPGPVRRLLRRCLARVRTRRLGDMSVARLEIEEVDNPPDPRNSPDGPDSADPSDLGAALWRRPVATLTLGLALGLLIGFGFWSVARVPSAVPGRVTRFPIVLPEGNQVAGIGTPRRFLAISPTGEQLAYARGDQLYLRRLDRLDAELLDAGGSGLGPVQQPFFSRDGRSLGYFSANRLMTIALDGGPSTTLTPAILDRPSFASNPRGFWWGPDNSILFGRSDGLYRIAANGGELEVVVPLPDAAVGAADPQLLPDGQHVLFTKVNNLSGGTSNVFSMQNDAQAVVASLDTGEYSVLLDGGVGARYLPTGHIIYVSEGTAFAVPFDADRLELTGEPIAVIEEVRQIANLGSPHLAVSDDGTLVYVAGRSETSEIVWVARDGSQLPAVAAEPDRYGHIRLSPDGRRVVSDAPGGIWVLDIERGARLRLTPSGDHPIWTPDGAGVTFSRGTSIVTQSSDGRAGAEEIVSADTVVRPISWTPDGQTLLFERASASGSKVWAVERDGDASVVLQGEFVAGGPQMSPDGRWLAYASTESGRMEVYVQPFPGPGGRVPISIDGGRAPVWTRDGRELIYRNDSAVLVVEIATEPQFLAGRPRRLFEGTYVSDAGAHQRYDVSADGERFLMVRDGASGSAEIRVVLNWFEEWKARVPNN